MPEALKRNTGQSLWSDKDIGGSGPSPHAVSGRNVILAEAPKPAPIWRYFGNWNIDDKRLFVCNNVSPSFVSKVHAEASNAKKGPYSASDIVVFHRINSQYKGTKDAKLVTIKALINSGLAIADLDKQYPDKRSQAQALAVAN